MRHTIAQTKRVPFHVRRWEAKRRLTDHSWFVAYGLTRRGAIRKLNKP